MLVADLQAWGKCANCSVVIWTETTVHEQRCTCNCSNLSIHDDVVTGDADGSFTKKDMQVILDAEYPPKLTVADLADAMQIYAKCNTCGEVLWCETSEHEQRCGCVCGGLQLHNEVITGEIDTKFTKQDFVQILEAERLA